MSNTFYWNPSSDFDADHYEVEKSATELGTYSALATIAHDFAGANYLHGRFFYVDAAGILSDWYRVRTVDAAGQMSAWYTSQAQIESAMVRVLIKGKVLTPDGDAPTKGTITCTLSQPGSALDGTISQRVGMVVTGTLEADGSMPEGFRLVPNDVITPGGTVYTVHIVAVEDGITKRWTETWQLASSPDPIDVGAVPRLNVVPGVTVPPVADATTTSKGIVKLAGDLAGTAAAPTVIPATGSAAGKVKLANDLGGTSDAPEVVGTHFPSPLPEAQGGTAAASLGAGLVVASGALTPRSLAIRAAAREQDPMDWGAIADGASHPLSTRYATLAQAQADYPHATALTQEIDWAAIQAAINAGPTDGGPVCVPLGVFKLSGKITLKKYTSILGSGMGLPTGGAGDATTLDATLFSNDRVLSAPTGARGNVYRDLRILMPTATYNANSIGIDTGANSSNWLIARVFVYGGSRSILAQGNVSTLLDAAVQESSHRNLEIAGNEIKVIGGTYANASPQNSDGGNIVVMGVGGNHLIAPQLVDEAFGNGVGCIVVLGADRVTIRDTKIYHVGSGYGIRLGNGTSNPTNALVDNVRIQPFSTAVPTYTMEIRGTGHTLRNVSTNPNGGGDINDLASDTTWVNVNGKYKLPSLPSASPGAGSKQLYYDPADGNRVKFAP